MRVRVGTCSVRSPPTIMMSSLAHARQHPCQVCPVSSRLLLLLLLHCPWAAPHPQKCLRRPVRGTRHGQMQCSQPEAQSWRVSAALCRSRRRRATEATRAVPRARASHSLHGHLSVGCLNSPPSLQPWKPSGRDAPACCSPFLGSSKLRQRSASE
jgi:hypothetical protein